MRSAIIFTIVCAFVTMVACYEPTGPSPWAKVCPPLAESKPVCGIREDPRNVFGKVQYFLTFLSECFLEQYNIQNWSTTYKVFGPVGKTCDDLGKIEPFILDPRY